MTLDIGGSLSWIVQRRWFSGRGEDVSGITVVDHALVDENEPALALAVVEVTSAEATRSLYHLPLLVDGGGAARDALEMPERLGVLGTLMASGASVDGERGAFHFAGAGLDPHAIPGAESIRPLNAEQSHTSVLLDEKIILKLFRRVEPGRNPDLELTRLLTNEGFEHIAPHVGDISYENESMAIDLGIAQHFIAESQGGWEVALKELDRLYADALQAAEQDDLTYAVEERTRDLLDAIDDLGEVTASLHVALAREEMDPDFIPEPVEVADLKSWASLAHEYLARARGGERDAGDVLQRAEERIDQLLSLPGEEAGSKIRIHGDFHLGQVLLSPRGWTVIDLEGEPGRPIEERRAKYSPLKDVAGLLRSVSYAASFALAQRAEPGSREWDVLEPWADTWEDLARQRFARAYLRRAHEGRWLPADRDVRVALLQVFEIQKALYELDYERRHRPEWMAIPLRGLRRLLGD